MANSLIKTALAGILGVVIIIFLIPMVSYIVSQFTNLEGIAAGPMLTYAIVVVFALVLPLFLGVKEGFPTKKSQILYTMILLGVGIWAAIYLPTLIPEFFSASPVTAVGDFGLKE